MKTRFLTKAGAAAFTLMIACGALTGCADKDVYNPNAGKPELKPEGEYFDFTTTTNVDFDVNYGKFAAGSLLEIYIKDPITYNENGTYSINGEAQYKIFADANGCFKGKVELATVTDKVYIYSPSWGAPMYVEADVENGKVTIDTTVEDETVTRSMATTRVAENLQVWRVSGKTNLYSIVNWDGNKHGRPNDLNKIIEDGNMGTAIASIQNKLWKNPKDGKKPDRLDNSSLVTDTEHVNTVIARAYKDEDEKVHNIESAQIWLTFLTESAWHQNAIGYYYYPSDKVPTSANDVKRYIIFPNASVTGNVPYMKDKAGTTNGGPYDFGKSNAPVSTNRKIQLLYVDGNNNVSTDFPAGYTIGYFIMPKEYQSGNNNSDGTYKLSDKYIYSNNTLNAGQAKSFISLSTKDGTVVYGVEDGGDQSYEDILFCIQADPKEAIQDPDRPVIDPEEPIITTTEKTYRTYAFEDTWPQGGDYDLNDVIIEHKRQITITNKNYVTKVEDTFVPTQKKDAATFTNAFAVQFASSQRGTITLPAGAIDELAETSSVILFPNANAAKDQAFTVTRTFGSEELTKDKLNTDIKSLNPFIISQYTAGEINRIEVHLPKNQPTSKADPTQIGAQDDAYYINKNGKYPFAIMLPERSASETEIKFIPATEKTSIDKEYPDFTKWVESGGINYTNWYQNYSPIQ